MPVIPVNYIAVLVAAIANMVLGFLWYGPIFGKRWIALMGFTPAQIKEGQSKGMAKQMILGFIGALVMNYVLAHSLIFANTYLSASGVSAGLAGGFWNWLGFVAPVTLSSVLWEGKSWSLWILNNGYWLLSLLVGGVILALWA